MQCFITASLGDLRAVQVPGRIKNMEESIYSTIDVIFTAQNLDRQLRFHYFRCSAEGEGDREEIVGGVRKTGFVLIVT